jgi:hypothetical protein
MASTVTKIIKNSNILSSSSSELVTTKNLIRNFGSLEDYVEMHIEDPLGEYLFSVSPFTNYRIPGTYQPSESPTIQDLEFSPDVDLKNLGIQNGDYVITYNVLRPKIITNSNLNFFIKEISPDRTELRIVTNNISEEEFKENSFLFINEFQNQPFFKEFYLNFGKNQLIPAVNIALDLNPNSVSILVKLLNPLSTQYDVNALLGIVDQISNPQSFRATLTIDPIPAVFPTLRGPNFGLDLDDVRVGPTPYYNFNQIVSFSGSFSPQLQKLFSQLSASNFNIDVDYDNFENFIHYSSAARRLEGFRYKLENIEHYNSLSSSVDLSASPSAKTDVLKYEGEINKIIQSFDGYEQYLYFESTSFSWPKSTSVKPYINYSISSSQAVNWYLSYHESSSLYDDNNQNYLLYTLPGYLSENPDNELLFKFVSTVGHMFDDIWVHIKAITDLYQAKNDLYEGISKDLVYFALQSLGINVYSDQDGKNLFQYLYGVNQDGTYSYPTSSIPSSGWQETLVSASQYQLPGQDIHKGFYKRLYHNLPLLLKSKGTTRFIQYLTTLFGIPSTIMSPIEYGGVDKLTSSFEYEYDRFSYALNFNNISSYVDIPWVYTSQSLVRTAENNIVPNGVEFRFKTYTTSSEFLKNNLLTQSLFYTDKGGNDFSFNLLYTDTASYGSIYSGSSGDYGYFEFKIGNSTVTSSTIPVFMTGSDGKTDWYTVLLQRKNPDYNVLEVGLEQTYIFYVKNNIWGEIGHQTSASISIDNPSVNSIWYDQGSIFFGSGPYPFSGSMQDIRLWSNYLYQSTFDSHVLNFESIEGNNTGSSYNDLAARFSLGDNLYTYNHSIINEVASVAPDQTIQSWTASFVAFPNENNYSSFVEKQYADVANSGYNNPVTDKVRIVSGSEYGTQLLPHKSIVEPDIIPLTKDIHLLDMGLSPMDEINKAIIAAFGSTYDLDSIIGDPDTNAFIARNPDIGPYAELESLRNEFFKRFPNVYNYKDYIRLIEFFHNSLFRTLKDFIPARTNLSTGIVYKPHLLERPMSLRPEPYVTDFNNFEVTIDTAFISGGNGGDYYQPTYSLSRNTYLGPLTFFSDGRDFYTGEFPVSSSVFNRIKTTTFNPFTTFDPKATTYYSRSIWDYEYDALLNNVSTGIQSSLFKKVIYLTSESKLTQFTESIDLQDFTWEYKRHILPRYIGSKVESANYTFYSETNDISLKTYGKNASIDKNTIKFVFMQEAIASGSDLLSMAERTNLYIKFLIDENNNIIELNKRDYNISNESQKFNLYQIQNMFKQGEILNIALFDQLNPSRQVRLEGNKKIFAGGFRFSPILFKYRRTQTLYYKIDEDALPEGVPDGLDPNDYWLEMSDPEYGKNVYCIGFIAEGRDVSYRVRRRVAAPYRFKFTVEIEKTHRAGIDFDGRSFSYFYYTLYMDQGSTASNYTGVVKRSYSTSCFGCQQTVSGRLTSIARDNAADPRLYTIADEAKGSEGCDNGNGNCLRIDKNDPTQTIISCSALQSRIPGYPNWYFSGSLDTNGGTTEYWDTEYNFRLSKGDLVRFSDNSVGTGDYAQFKAVLEYEIVEVYEPDPSIPNSRLAFKINAPLQNVARLKASVDKEDPNYQIIPFYIFSKRVPDETNIVINFRKSQGKTSPGIVKNTNIINRTDEKIPEILNELKTKLFNNTTFRQ